MSAMPIDRADRRSGGWWKAGHDSIKFVPPGKLPEELGVDPRVAIPLPREPQPFEHWYGMRTGWRLNAVARDREAAEAAHRTGTATSELQARAAAAEARLGVLEAQLEALVAAQGGQTSGG
ncbi:MAG: hypothetical protein QOH86_1239 [Sphingomonadales bacterium]|jgi:hypothetical protein|nr:hypothetical protein [Sphingomonadales bacterium]